MRLANILSTLSGETGIGPIPTANSIVAADNMTNIRMITGIFVSARLNIIFDFRILQHRSSPGPAVQLTYFYKIKPALMIDPGMFIS